MTAISHGTAITRFLTPTNQQGVLHLYEIPGWKFRVHYFTNQHPSLNLSFLLEFHELVIRSNRGAMATGWDTSNVSAVAVLVVATFALPVAYAQALQQYLVTGQLIRLCDSAVFGPLPGQGHRVWQPSQFPLPRCVLHSANLSLSRSVARQKPTHQVLRHWPRVVARAQQE